MEREEIFMKEALRLAERGRGQTSPNPMVGAVLVRGNRIVGRGFHAKAGGAHAEVFAIREAGRKARGATIYVNLEPCNHFGRTPPCTDTIIKSRIKRVVCAMIDPNPRNNGRGIRKLRANGIKVKVGVLEKESRNLNKPFIKFITKKMPFVTVKVAESIDGKIATNTGDSKWITGVKARDFVHRLRRESDAILVGVNTIIKDNPLLTSRPHREFPIKVILDPELKTPPNAKIFSKKSPALVIIVAFDRYLRTKSGQAKARGLNKSGVLVIGEKEKGGRFYLRSILRRLAGLEVVHLLVEGGGTTIASFIEDRLVDRLLFFIAPKIIGGRDAITSVEGKGVDRISKAIKLKNIEVKNFDEDILITGEF